MLSFSILIAVPRTLYVRGTHRKFQISGCDIRICGVLVTNSRVKNHNISMIFHTMHRYEVQAAKACPAMDLFVLYDLLNEEFRKCLNHIDRY